MIMKDTKYYYGFYCLSRQNCFPNLIEINKQISETDHIMFGLYDLDGGCTAEMGIKWLQLSDEVAPRFEVFSDAFDLLKTEKILRLINNFDEDMTPETFSQLLIRHGFKDMSDNPLATT